MVANLLIRYAGTHDRPVWFWLRQLRYWPYVLIGLGGFFAYNYFGILRLLKRE
jgi:hypothetical protein